LEQIVILFFYALELKSALLKLQTLLRRIKELSANKPKALESLDWMPVHECLPARTHGVMPSEHDLREVDDNLCLSLLLVVKSVWPISAEERGY